MDRVRVLPHKLQLQVAALLAGRVAWLRQELLRLDGALGLQFPPLEVLPASLYDEFADGGKMELFARVGQRPFFGENTATYTVQLTGPTLLAFPDELLRGVLAHEFLHVVADTLKAYRFFKNGGAVYRQEIEDGYDDSIEQYKQIDRQILADPAQWLPPHLREAAQRVESGVDSAFQAATKDIETNWRQYFPWERSVPGQGVGIGRLIFDQAIIARAEQLQIGN